MALMTWQDDFSVGVPSIDNEHKKLIEMINQLHDARMNETVPETIKTILNDLIAYTGTHFTHEETIFAEHGYAETEAHTQHHKDLVAQVLELQAKVNADPKAVIGQEAMDFLRDWLTNHILIEDKQYASFMAEHGVQ